jgi:TIR domain
MSEPTQVFISYARTDGLDVAGVVQAELENSGFKVWRDLRDLDAFADFSVEIERAIIASDSMVVCVTPSIAHARESFVRREILYAQSKGKPIVPLRIANAEIPILIVHLTWIDVSEVAGINGNLAGEIQRRLHMQRVVDRTTARSRPTVVFIRGLLDDIVTVLEATTEVLLDIAATGWSKSKPLRGGLPSSMQKLVRSQSSTRVTPARFHWTGAQQ